MLQSRYLDDFRKTLNAKPRTPAKRTRKPTSRIKGNRPQLSDMIRRAPKDESWAVFGKCEDGRDGRPFRADFTDPRNGTVQIVGEDYMGKKELLRAVYTSASRLRSAKWFNYFLVTDTNNDLGASNHRQGILKTGSEVSYKLLRYAKEYAEKGVAGDSGPLLLLAIENLDRFLETISNSDREVWGWLLKHGSKRGVWIVGVGDKKHDGFKKTIETTSLPFRFKMLYKQQYVKFWVPII